MIHYNLMTFDVLEMFKIRELITNNGTVSVDFQNLFVRSRILLHTERHADNAMYWQLISCLKKDAASFEQMRNDENALGRVILYLDFKSIADVFRDKEKDTTAEDAFCRNLVEDGFSVLYSDAVVKNYVVFDRSNSMAREAQTSFVDKAVFPQIEERVRIGMPWDEIKVQLSKFYSYRGLLFSDGQRISDPDFVLNEKTVIVIPDDNHNVSATVMKVANTGINRRGETTISEPEVVEKEIGINAFDGEGLISPAYADLINKVRYQQRKKGRRATSFQIRMPFAKGMLHEVDFHAFIREACGEYMSEKDAEIKDAFGIVRRLEDARIILTASMFKCHEWLREFKEKVKDKKETYDPVQYYFEQMHQYDHALYLVGTNQDYSARKKVPLNYQFVNTLALDGQQIDKLLRRHLKEANDSRRLAIEATQGVIRETEEAVYVDEKAIDEGNFPLWITALRLNSAFRRDPYIKRMIDAEREARVKDVARGRLMVEGRNRLLSGDLLALMIHLIRRTEKHGYWKEHDLQNQNASKQCIEKNNVYWERYNRQKAGVITALIEKTMGADWFFDARYKELNLRKGYRYGILRNPHLSRNEQCAQRAYVPEDENDLYYRYFSHLDRVLMLSFNSLAAMILGGADYDGDTVKLILSDTINDAILKAYQKKEDFQTGKTRFERKYPIIEIPRTGRSPETIPKYISYDQLRRIFAGRIGQISNLAVRIGAIAYKTGDPAMETDCALCTVLTGLEIDAAKNGSRPDLSFLRKKYSSVTEGRTDYIELKDWIINYRHLPGRRSIEQKVMTPEGGIEYSVIRSRRGRNRQKKEFFLYPPEQRVSNVDRLCGYIIQDIYEKKPAVREKKDSEPTLFKFQMDETFEYNPEWKDNLKKDSNIDNWKLLAELVTAYNEVLRKAERLSRDKKRAKENNNHLNKIYTLLYSQYDRSREVLPDSGAKIEDAINMTRADLSYVLNGEDTVKRAMEQLKESEWAFADKEERGQILQRILDRESFGEEAEELLLNGFADGFYVLYHYLKTLENDCLEEAYMQDEALEEDEDFETDEAGREFGVSKENRFYQKLKKICMEQSAMNASNKALRDAIIRECRNIMQERNFFGGDLSKALSCYCAQRETIDPSGRFLWEVFPPNVIIENVVEGQCIAEGTEHAE